MTLEDKHLDLINNCLFFCDVEGFTRITESLQAKVIPVLGIYLEKMCGGIIKFQGDIEKFIGDSIFAYFLNEQIPSEAANQCFDSLEELDKRTRQLWVDSKWIELFNNKNWNQFIKFKTRFFCVAIRFYYLIMKK